jgi:hypothetical protein
MEYIAHKTVWWPGKMRIAGRTLRPMTLGQLRILEAVNSAYISGRPVDDADITLALYILTTPWRRARHGVHNAYRMAWRMAWLRLRHGRHLPVIAGQLREYVDVELWTPDRFEKAGTATFYNCATGIAVRMAMRAAALPLQALCHISATAWQCVWDVPVRAILCYGVAHAEIKGAEFMTVEELIDITTESQ